MARKQTNSNRGSKKKSNKKLKIHNWLTKNIYVVAFVALFALVGSVYIFKSSALSNRPISYTVLDNAWANQNIWLINADGTGKKQLTTDNGSSSGVTSYDASGVVFRSDKKNSNGDLQSGLQYINIDGSGRRRLTTPPLNYYDVSHEWSPDNQQIAYVRFKTTSAAELRAVNVDGTNDHKIIGLNSFIYGVKWLPNTKVLYFNTQDKLYSINLDGTGFKTISSDFGDNFLITRDSKEKVIYYKAGTSADTINSMNIDGTGSKVLTFKRHATTDGSFIFTRSRNNVVTVNGKDTISKIVFMSQYPDSSVPGGFRQCITTMYSDGSNQRDVWCTYNRIGEAVWSTDGNNISFGSDSVNTGSTYWTINTINADGTNRKVVAKYSGANYGNVWSW